MVPDEHNLYDDATDDLKNIEQKAQDIKGAADTIKDLTNRGNSRTQAAGGMGTPQDHPGQEAASGTPNMFVQGEQPVSSGHMVSGGKGGGSLSAAAESAGTGAGAAATSSAASSMAASGAAASGAAASGAAAGAAVGTSAGPAGTAIGAAVGAIAKPVIKFVVALVLFVILLLSAIIMYLPRVIFGADFNLNNFGQESLSIQDAASEVITAAYAEVFNRIVAQAEKGGYDVDLTISNITDMSGGANNVDMVYLICTYSVSMQNSDRATREDMLKKLNAVKNSLYRYETHVETAEKEVPVTVDAYEEYTFTIATSPTYEQRTYYEITNHIPFNLPKGIYLPLYEPIQVEILGSNGRTKTVTLYEKTNKLIMYDPLYVLEIPVYKPVSVNVPVSPETQNMTGYRKIGTMEIDKATMIPTYEEREFSVLTANNKVEKQKHWVAVGEKEVIPEKIEVKYLAATIYPIQKSDIHRAFSYDPEGWFYETREDANYEGTRNKVILDDMISQYTMLLNDNQIKLYRSYTESNLSIEAPDIQALYPGLIMPPCSDNRLFLLEIGASLVGKVPYFFGGNHGSNYCHPGWNEEWNTEIRTVTGGSKAGQKLPFGLDCSGFVKWTYATAFGADIFGRSDYTGTMLNSSLTYPITADQLLPGDLGLSDGHVGIFAGYNKAGKRVWLHSRGYMGDEDDIAFSTHSGLVHFRRVAAVAERLEGNDLRQEADLMTRLGIAGADKSAIDYTDPEYQWIAHLQDQPAQSLIKYQKEFEIKYYCMCPDCTGKETRGLTSSGQQYRTGIVASRDLPIGTKIGLYGKIFTVQDTVQNAEANTIYVYLPQHRLLSVVRNRKLNIPVYS